MGDAVGLELGMGGMGNLMVEKSGWERPRKAGTKELTASDDTLFKMAFIITTTTTTAHILTMSTLARSYRLWGIIFSVCSSVVMCLGWIAN